MSTFLGLAIAMINELKAKILNTKRNGLILVFHVDEKPLVPLNFSDAETSFPFQNCQKIAIGSNKNSQKNSGFKKETSFIMAG